MYWCMIQGLFILGMWELLSVRTDVKVVATLSSVNHDCEVHTKEMRTIVLGGLPVYLCNDIKDDFTALSS